MAAGSAFLDEAAQLFADFHSELRMKVRRRVRTSDANIDDACAQAWLIFVSRQPENVETFRGWLIVVATRLAIDLAQEEAGTIYLANGHAARGARAVSLDIVPEQHVTDAARMEVKDALERVAELCPRDRHVFVLHVLGYKYPEIADLMGLTPTAVDRYLRRARAQVRGTSAKPKRGPQRKAAARVA
ncbi:MAG TPA: sigma-70 family RNA polymerase sigma factor [Solirubrobacteraceae bacterium]|nr:sigma-70 family RNA polymerase sigma factor [Solirubrobacteraceae bacterium]